ncbi:MAG TPA: VWA domain-containing protein [Myxococcota bacterium]|nr:VWA domain-containing protein [Myxococcota bacterium]HRY91976.1 VWA domain-containing protein [Myxococcota bacterium]HSA21378.1 VWA domain-containing protein [Myxococcota bacterium]
MRLFGLTAAEFTLLFAAAATVALIAYLLSFRRRAARVATAPIWRLVASRRRTPLRKLLALALELLVLLLLCLALADPREEPGQASPPVYLAVAVDVSASMGALEEGGTRLDLARLLVGRLAAELGPRDRLLLLAMDDGCRPLGRFEREPAVIGQALASLAPSAVAEDLPAALEFAGSALLSEAVPEQAERRLVVVSDRFHPVGELDPRLGLWQLAVGEPRDNLALTAFDLRRRGGAAKGSEVFVEVSNLGRRERAVRLALHTRAALLGEEELRVPAGGQTSRAYFLQPIEEAEVMASLLAPGGGGAADAFSLDDRAYGLVPQRVARKVLLVTPGNLFLEKALGLDPSLALSVQRPDQLDPASLQGAGEAGFQAAVFDGLCPATGVPSLYFDPPGGPGCPFAVAEEVVEPVLGPVRGDHPVTTDLNLVDLQAQAARRLVPEAGDLELWSDAGGPIMLARERGGLKLLGLGLDPARSDLPLRVAFPLLLHNSLAWFLGEEPDLGAQERSVGGLIPLPDWAARGRVETPDGSSLAPLALGGRTLLRPRLPGFYRVQAGRERLSVPVAFQLRAESDLAGDRQVGPSRLRWAGGELPAELRAGLGGAEPVVPPPQWPRLLLAVVWLLLFDWVFYCFRILF